jgi:hypothetical protein
LIVCTRCQNALLAYVEGRKTAFVSHIFESGYKKELWIKNHKYKKCDAFY